MWYPFVPRTILWIEKGRGGGDRQCGILFHFWVSFLCSSVLLFVNSSQFVLLLSVGFICCVVPYYFLLKRILLSWWTYSRTFKSIFLPICREATHFRFIINANNVKASKNNHPLCFPSMYGLWNLMGYICTFHEHLEFECLSRTNGSLHIYIPSAILTFWRKEYKNIFEVPAVYRIYIYGI